MGKSEWLKVRLSPDEKRAFQQAADLAGLSLSAWMRERLRRIAANELETANVPIPFYQLARRVAQ